MKRLGSRRKQSTQTSSMESGKKQETNLNLHKSKEVTFYLLDSLACSWLFVVSCD